jgi:hypothetical protein
MRLIKDTTTELYFNKNYYFTENYVVGSSITAVFTITSKETKKETIFTDIITDVEAQRYFIMEAADITGIAEGTYTFKLELLCDSTYEEFEVGILQREIKIDANSTYDYATDADTAFVYND